MELARITAAGIEGVDGYPVQVEVNRHEPASGNGRTTIVGLPDQAVRESIDRVTPALFNSGLKHRPHDHLVVNLAPADRRKEGPAFDLAIALGFAATMPDNRLDLPRDTLFLAELALDGALRPVRGVLAAALAAQAAGLKRIVVAPGNGAEAAVVEGLNVHAPKCLADCVQALRDGWAGAVPVSATTAETAIANAPCLSDVRGQDHAKRALVVAARSCTERTN
jgi:magnesium chelatase family protein